MINTKKIFSLILCISVFSVSAWSNTDLQSLFLKEIRRSGFSSEHFGLWVKDKNILVSLNSEKKFIPASLSKIPTALAALSHFPMNHHFYTWVKATGKIQNGTLKGDLYLEGGGDPTLVSESLWTLVQKLKREGISTVEGQLYYDDSYFDQKYFPDSRQKRRVDRAYDAPVSALSFNWNSVAVYIRPGEKGQEAKVFVDPPVPYISVKNRAKTVGRRSKTRLVVKRVSLGGKEEIQVSGQISVSKKEKTFYKSISNPSRWTAENFKFFMENQGIQILGSVQPKNTPSEARELVAHESWELSRIISALSKYSNNFIAEMLTKNLSRISSDVGSLDGGLKKIHSFLSLHGWKEGSYEFANPSGLTYDNQFSPALLGQLLVDAQQMFPFFSEFLSSLPLAGWDGTLKDRMGSIPGKVRAKTGYLTGTVGLGGYVQGKKGRQGIFVFMYNGPKKNDWGVKALFDRMAAKLHTNL